MRKLPIISILILMFSLVLASAQVESFGRAEQNQQITLIQTYNATQCNITSITSPDFSESGQGLMTKSGNKFSLILNSGNTTQLGEYKVCGDCDSSVWCASYEVTTSGEKFDITQSFGLIGQLVLIALFASLGFAFAKEKWKIRTFFFMMSIIMGVITLNSIRIIMGSSNSLSSMGNSGLILGIVVLSFMILYVLIYATKEVFGYFKQKKEARWNPY